MLMNGVFLFFFNLMAAEWPHFQVDCREILLGAAAELPDTTGIAAMGDWLADRGDPAGDFIHRDMAARRAMAADPYSKGTAESVAQVSGERAVRIGIIPTSYLPQDGVAHCLRCPSDYLREGHVDQDWASHPTLRKLELQYYGERSRVQIAKDRKWFLKTQLPIDSLHLVGFDLEGTRFSDFRSSPLAARLTELAFSNPGYYTHENALYYDFELGGWDRLLSAPSKLTQLRVLKLESSPRAFEALGIIKKTPFRETLEELSVTSGRGADPSVDYRALLDHVISNHPRLTRLTWHFPREADAWLVNENPDVERLTQLHLNFSDVHHIDLATLFNPAPENRLKNLTELKVRANGNVYTDGRELFQEPAAFAKKLVKLDLDLPLPERAFTELFKKGKFPALRSLRFRSPNFSDQNFKELCDWTQVTQLEELVLEAGHISPTGFRVLLNSRFFRNLKILRLRGVAQNYSHFLEVLSEWGGARNLHTLELVGNVRDYEERDLEPLRRMNSHLKGLVSLDLSLGKAAEKSSVAQQRKWLNLYLPDLVSLRILNHQLADKTIKGLFEAHPSLQVVFMLGEKLPNLRPR